MKSDTHMSNGPFRMHAAAKQMQSIRKFGPWEMPLNYVGSYPAPALLYQHAFSALLLKQRKKNTSESLDIGDNVRVNNQVRYVTSTKIPNIIFSDKNGNGIFLSHF